MAKGILNIQAADGAVIGLHVPDGLTSGERQIALGANLSGITAYHLLQGNLAVSNSVTTQGFNTTLYTSGSAVTDIDMNTQWGNTVEEKFGGLVWLKDRVEATNNFWYDTIRGATKEINSNTTEAEATLAGGLTAFNSTGFTVGADAGHNSTTNNMVSWNFQTTHRVSGTTNHGKAYTCHYNPFTGFTMVKYEGSGIAGHEIPHHLGRGLGFVANKVLTSTLGWACQYRDGYQLPFTAGTEANDSNAFSSISGNTSLVCNNGTLNNASGSTYIMYGWANSYFDESNKLIGNYEIGVYQGTGTVGNKVITRGKPAWIMIKRLDSTGNWVVFDNQRGNSDYHLYPNLSNAEGISVGYGTDFYSDGFAPAINGAGVAWIDTNVSGGQFLYMVAYDTNSNGGGSYYPLASDASNVQINNALIPLAQGIDSNGVKNTILSKNETITGLTYTAGKNYVYCDGNGNYGVTPYKPRFLKSELVRTFASEAPEYYDVGKNKWFSTSGNGELITNGTFDSGTTGWSVTTGFTMSVQNGTLKIDRNITTPTGGVYQNIVTTIGKKYRLILDINYISGGGVSIWIDSGNTLSTYATVVGKQYIEFTAINSSTKIEFLQSGVAGTGTINIDNISVFATEIVPTTEITNSRNYLNHIVHADNDGGVLYVEELPKVEYKDIVKANEFRGKNAIWGYIVVDCTTTPVTIKDSMGISSVIRTAFGNHRFYFEKPVDNLEFGWSYGGTGSVGYSANAEIKTLNYVNIATYDINGASGNNSSLSINFYGGRN